MSRAVAFSSIWGWVVRFFKDQHTWAYEEPSLTRTCTVCKQVEEYDLGDGMVGPSWDILVKGEEAAHATKPQPVRAMPGEDVPARAHTSPEPAALK